MCRSLHAEALQAPVSEGLAQGPYVATRVGFEPANLRTEGTEHTTKPPRPTYRVTIITTVSVTIISTSTTGTDNNIVIM